MTYLKTRLSLLKKKKKADWTESEEELESQGPKEAKDLKAQKKVTIKGKRSDPAPTRGPGSQAKRIKVKKVLTRDQRISLLEK